MSKLLLLRHFKSQWNFENRFTGWVDVPLLKERSEEEKEISKKVSESGFEVVYTSPLIRNLTTVLEVFKYIDQKYPIFRYFQGKMKKWANFAELNKNYIPVYVSEALNERYYGKLQGLNKEEVMKKYGKDLVHKWRRSFYLRPPAGETLKDVYKRAIPFYKKYVEKDLKEGKNVLIVASHNSARAIIKYLEKISDEDISNIEMPFGGLITYEFDGRLYKK
jgi:2,3-bisphosphoglycerate-dependent phosphoglycerate mutase